MTNEEWELVKEILDHLLKLPETERLAYIISVTEGHPNVRASVLELLPHYKDDSAEPRNAAHYMLSPGQIIASRFRIIRLIAAGGMGEVYEAEDEWLHSRLALKTLRYGRSADAGAIERFKRELLIARGVAHRNVCRVHDFVEHREKRPDGEETVTPCFTMELLEGETLADVLARERPLAISAALEIFRQVVSGLTALHERNIVHRDLKPSNIMISSDADGRQRIVVMDFGLAKAAIARPDLFESAPDFEIAGAPYFMSPELMRGERPSIASDVYALGLVIDESVTVSRAFLAKCATGLVFDKMQTQPIAPSQRSQELPAHWERVILRCLEADPLKRFGSAAALLEALENPSRTEPAPVSEAEPPAPLQVAPKRRRFPRWSVLVITVAIFLLLSVAALSAYQPINISVQVFDIENLTKVSDFDYLAKGTMDQVMGSLLKVPGVRVFAVHNTRSQNPNAHAARFSLEGTLQTHSGQIRLAMQLTDNQNGGDLLWSEYFDRDHISDPLRLQTEIAEKATVALQSRMLFGSAHGLTGVDAFSRTVLRTARWLGLWGMRDSRLPTSNAYALDLYMRGHALLEESSPSSAKAAIEYFCRAIEYDPGFALAYASAADASMQLMNYNYESQEQLAREAREYARRAIELDPLLPQAHTVMAAVKQMDWDWKGAEESFQTALQLNSEFGRARRWHAGLLAQFGRWDDAIQEAERAIQSDPLDRSAPTSTGFYLFLAGRHEDAIRLLTRALAEKDAIGTRSNLAEVYAWLGHTTTGRQSAEYFHLALAQAEAIERTERQLSTDGRTPFTDRIYALIYACEGDFPQARPYLDRLERDMDKYKTSPVNVAWVYAMFGQSDRACDLLDKAVKIRDRKLMYTKVIPFLTQLRGVPRFDALLKQMNLG